MFNAEKKYEEFLEYAKENPECYSDISTALMNFLDETASGAEEVKMSELDEMISYLLASNEDRDGIYEHRVAIGMLKETLYFLIEDMEAEVDDFVEMIAKHFKEFIDEHEEVKEELDAESLEMFDEKFAA